MPVRQRKATARQDPASGRLPRPKGRTRTGLVPPAGTPENVAQLVGPTGSAPGVAEQIDPLVERNADRVVGLDVFGQAKADRVGGIFRFKGAEKLSQMISVPPWLRSI